MKWDKNKEKELEKFIDDELNKMSITKGLHYYIEQWQMEKLQQQITEDAEFEIITPKQLPEPENKKP